MEPLVTGNNPAIAAQSPCGQEQIEAVVVSGRRINSVLLDHLYMKSDDISGEDDLRSCFTGASTGQREVRSLSHVSKREPAPERKELHDNCRFLRPLKDDSRHWFSRLEHNDCSKTLDFVSNLSDLGKGTVLQKLSSIPDTVKAEAMECTTNYMRKLQTGINLLSESIQDRKQYPQHSSHLFYMASSEIHGQGVFASQDLENGTTVGRYAGSTVFKKASKVDSGRFYVFKVTEEITSTTSEKRLAIDYLKDDKHVAWSEVKIYGTDIEVGISGDNDLKYLNHSKKGNVFLNVSPPQNKVPWSGVSSISIDVIALQDIHCGEELVFDYNPQVKEIDFSINPVILPDENVKQEIKRRFENLLGQMEGDLPSPEKHRLRRKGRWFKSNPAKRVDLKKQRASESLVQAGSVSTDSGNVVKSQKRTLRVSLDTSPAPRKQEKIESSTISENKAHHYDVEDTQSEKQHKFLKVDLRSRDTPENILVSAHAEGVTKSMIFPKTYMDFVKGCEIENFNDQKFFEYHCLWKYLGAISIVGGRKLNKDMESRLNDLKKYINNTEIDLTLRKRLYWTQRYYWARSGLTDTWSSEVANPSLGAVEASVHLDRELPGTSSESSSGVNNNLEVILNSASEDGVTDKLINTSSYKVFVKECFSKDFGSDKWFQYCRIWQDLSEMPEKRERTLNEDMKSALEALKQDINNTDMDLTLRKRLYWTHRYFWAVSELPETEGSTISYPTL